MEKTKTKIKDIFTKDRYFEIPKYQRSYAWEQKQIKDFFEDFKSNYDIINYYYGTLLLQEISEEQNREKFEIVDGQQRITTLIIFIYCLIKKMREKIDELKDVEEDDIKDLEKEFIIHKGIYKLTLQQQEMTYFQSCVIGEEGNLEATTPAQKRLKNAKNKFMEWINNLSNEELIKIKDRICNANALVYIIEDKKEAAMIFETTNDRGKPLTNLEKIKSFLMYKVSLNIEEPEQLLKTIESTFINIYNNYEKISKDFDEDSILQYNFIANEENKNKEFKKSYQHYMEILKQDIEELAQKGLIEKNKKEQLKKQGANTSDIEVFSEFTKYINRYLTNLNNSYDNMEKIENKPCKEYKNLKSLRVRAPFYPLLIKTYKYDNTEDKKYFKRTCELCEIFSFRIYVILNFNAYKYLTKWYDFAKEFGESEEKLSEIELKEEFETLYKKITKIIYELGDDKKFLNELGKDNFYNSYSAIERNYFFWRYENYLRENYQPKENAMSHENLWEKENNQFKLTIEHIVSRANTQEQEGIIKNEDIEIKDEKTFEEKYLHCIGNLVIDTQSSNSSKGKKDTEEKTKNYYSESTYKSQKKIEEYFADTNERKKWTIKSIEDRKKDIQKIAEKIWCEPIWKYRKNQEEIDVNNNEEDEEENDIVKEKK